MTTALLILSCVVVLAALVVDRCEARVRRHAMRRVDETIVLLRESLSHGAQLLDASQQVRDELEKRTRELEACRAIFAQYGLTLHLAWAPRIGQERHLSIALLPAVGYVTSEEVH